METYVYNGDMTRKRPGFRANFNFNILDKLFLMFKTARFSISFFWFFDAKVYTLDSWEPLTAVLTHLDNGLGF